MPISLVRDGRVEVFLELTPGFIGKLSEIPATVEGQFPHEVLSKIVMITVRQAICKPFKGADYLRSIVLVESTEALIYISIDNLGKSWDWFPNSGCFHKALPLHSPHGRGKSLKVES
jgi:hypothetical protein